MVDIHQRAKNYFYLCLFATLLTLLVIVLGAYTRLSDAGLGCPDWPTCYGKLIPSNEANVVIDTKKAWIEMIHRYIAGLLGFTIVVIAWLSIGNRHASHQPLLLPLSLVLLVIFQSLLGMWTVTLKLLPLIVMAHLMGGFTTLALLWWLCLQLHTQRSSKNQKNQNLYLTNEGRHSRRVKFLAIVGFIVFILQLFLGGWTSANYAALVCVDFPYCQGRLMPTLHLRQAFDFHLNNTETWMWFLDNNSLVTIHMIHRLGALVTTFLISLLVFQVLKRNQNMRIRILACTSAILLVIQILLGITNVIALLPLSIALAHNAVAALLLLSLLSLNYYLHTLSATR